MRVNWSPVPSNSSALFFTCPLKYSSSLKTSMPELRGRVQAFHECLKHLLHTQPKSRPRNDYCNTVYLSSNEQRYVD